MDSTDYLLGEIMMGRKDIYVLIVGSGLFGSVAAYELKKHGKRVLVLERRKHIGGNIYTENREGIDVHVYGPHIFHTNKKAIWDYVNELTFFKPMAYAPIACYGRQRYNLPFNMHTFYEMWGTTTPEEASIKLAEQRAEYAGIEPQNLEEQALKLVGRDIYEKLIKGYTQKQWGRKCTELPAFIIRRLPVRLTWNNNYFNDTFQGIPEKGYTELVRQLLQGIEVFTEVDFLKERTRWQEKAEQIVYTGRIDEYFDEKLGALEYRSLRFETETLPIENYQGAAVVNYTAADIPYTRITEHKHFLQQESRNTIISREYPQEWRTGVEPYYPVNDDKNTILLERYKKLAETEQNVFFGGRLGMYRYFNMDQVIEEALNLIKSLQPYS